MSIDEFNVVSNAHKSELEMLNEEFDRLLAIMQTPAAGTAMKAAFNATPKEFGRVAAAAARKRE
jgi:hypothetical protein